MSYNQSSPDSRAIAGYTILEVMVASGLGGVVSLALMSVSTLAARGQRNVAQLSDFQNLVSIAQNALRADNICSRNFSRLPAFNSGSTGIPVSDVFLYSGAVQGPRVLQTGAQRGQLRISNMSLTPIGLPASYINAGSGTILATFHLEAEKLGESPLGASNIVTKTDIPVTLQVTHVGPAGPGGANRIDGCGAGAPTAGSPPPTPFTTHLACGVSNNSFTICSQDIYMSLGLWNQGVQRSALSIVSKGVDRWENSGCGAGNGDIGPMASLAAASFSNCVGCSCGVWIEDGILYAAVAQSWGVYSATVSW